MTAFTDEQERMETHPNGGGKRGSEVSCSKTAYLDKVTEIHDDCTVWGSPQIVQSKLYGNCKVTGRSTLYAVCAIGFVSFHDKCQLVGCDLETAVGSEINLYDDACLTYCFISTPPRARVEIGEKAKLVNCRIKGTVHLEGDVWIQGCELESGTYLHQGVWTKPPLMTRTEDGWVFSECVPGYMHCGCQCHKIEDWENGGARLGRRFGFTDREIEFCDVAARELIRQIRAKG